MAAVQLDLEAARLRREVEDHIKAELKRLPTAERRSVLEYVFVDILADLKPNGASRHGRAGHGAASAPQQKKNGASSQPAASAAKAPPAPTLVPSPVPPQDGLDGERHQWQRILEHCRVTPMPEGGFHAVAVAKTLLQERFAESRNVAISIVTTAVKRKSVGQARDPYFMLLGRGRWRLATSEERAKALEGEQAI